MPKVYDQQISWQAPATQKMQYDKLQDFITPALQNVTKASQNATDLMVEIGDKRAAGELEQAAKDAAFDIENWQDFSEPEKTQDKMVESAMAKYDAVMANLDPSTRRRMDMYNPKAREIYEVKAKEKAADVSYNYAYKAIDANMDNDIGRMIEEKAPQGYQSVNAEVDAYLQKLKPQLRPADYVVAEHKAKRGAELGLGDWYIANNMLDKALTHFQNDKASGDIDEVTRAHRIKTIKSAMNSAGSEKGVGQNIVDASVRNLHYNIYDAYALAGEIARSVYTGSSVSPATQAILDTGLPVVKGLTWKQFDELDQTKKQELISDLLKTAEKNTLLQQEANQAFVGISSEWQNLTDDNGNVKKGADFTTLISMAENFRDNGFDMVLMNSGSPFASDWKKISAQIDLRNGLVKDSFDYQNKNMSDIQNNPEFAQFQNMEVPKSAAEAKQWNTEQQIEINQQVGRAKNSVGLMTKAAGMARIFGKEPKRVPGDNTYRSRLDDIYDYLENKRAMGMSEGDLLQIGRIAYNTSQGTGMALPRCSTKISPEVYVKCAKESGYLAQDNRTSYNPGLNRYFHALTHRMRISEGVPTYEDGTYGDVIQIVGNMINVLSTDPSYRQDWNMRRAYTSSEITHAMNRTNAVFRDKLGEVADYTNNNNIISRDGSDYDINWDPVNPTPETNIDINGSALKQIVLEFNKQLNYVTGNGETWNNAEVNNFSLELRSAISGKQGVKIKDSDSDSDVKELLGKERIEAYERVKGSKE